MRRRGIGLLLVVGGGVAAWLSGRAFLEQARIRALSGDPESATIVLRPFDLPGHARGDVTLANLAFLLALDLERAGGLRVVESLAGVRGRGEQPSRFTVVGRCALKGDSIALSIEVHDRIQGRRIVRSEAEGPRPALPTLLDRLALEILRSTLGERGPRQAPCLACDTSRSSAALAAYLAGESRYEAGDLTSAGLELKRAVHLDPGFGLAWLRLADVAEWTQSPRQEAAIADSMAGLLAERLPGRHAVRARARRALRDGSGTGLKELRSATRTWPRDPDIRALLASTLFLVGPATAASRVEAEQALARAADLRPTFAPAYVHRVDLAIASGDRGHAAALLDTLAALAPSAWFTADRRLRWTLAFGDSTARGKALLALRGDPVATLAAAREVLQAPEREATLREVLEALPDAGEERSEAMALLAWSQFLAGRPERALGILENAAMDEAWRLGTLYILSSRGVAVPDRMAAEATAALDDVEGPRDTAGVTRLFFAVVWSLERGDPAAGRSGLARLRLTARHATEAGDVSFQRFVVAAVRAIEGYDALRRAHDEDAIRRLEGTLVETSPPGPGRLVNAQIRWWLAEAHERLDQPHQALAYYESFWWDPMAARRAEALRARPSDRGDLP